VPICDEFDCHFLTENRRPSGERANAAFDCGLVVRYSTSAGRALRSSGTASTFVLEDTALPTRDDAWKLLCEYTESESLRKHMLAVEACVRAYARKQGADEETWGLAALLHDFDYERWPNEAHAPDKEHPAEGARILRGLGYSEEVVRAILSHADYCNVPRHSPLEHTLFACDELAGFLTACAYVRPSKSILDLEVDSVKRRMKDKAFAKGVRREDVRKGAEELGVPLEEHIGFCIAALREHADGLGLRGTIATQAAST
jgi:putative nucleotidyltransferase with HDIG domain